MNRRGFLQGILSAGVAPYVCTAAGVLMPVKKIVDPFDAITRQMLSLMEGRLKLIAEMTACQPLMVGKAGDLITYRRWLPWQNSATHPPQEVWTVPVADYMHPSRYRPT